MNYRMRLATQIGMIGLLLLFSGLLFAQEGNQQARGGNLHYENKKYKEAEFLYEEALKENPKHKQALFNKADALYKQGKFKEAEELLMSGRELFKGSLEEAKYFHNLGNTRLKQKKYQESIEAYKKALKLNPNDEETRYNLAYAQGYLKKQQEGGNKNKDQKQKQDKNKDKQEKGDKKKEGNEEEKKDENQNRNKPKELSKEEAERILEAIEKEEKDLQNQKRKMGKSGVPIKTDKDW